MTVPADLSRSDAGLNFDAYVALFESLTPERLDEFRSFCAEDVRFVDPFNEVIGIDRLIGVFRHMYTMVDDPRFDVIDRAMGQRAGYVRWRFSSRSKHGSRELILEGMSEIKFAADGRVCAHIDHWDPAGQLYARLPVIGWRMRRLARRLSASG